MKKSIFITLAIATSFCFGVAFKTVITPQNAKPKVTGIGGIFFKCKDPKKMRDWYQRHLGLNTNAYGATFEWYQDVGGAKKRISQWTPFKETTKYFEPSAKDYMINYTVDHLPELVEQLKADSVAIVDKMETVSYGKFIHILDVEGNKIELWEPVGK